MMRGSPISSSRRMMSCKAGIFFSSASVTTIAASQAASTGCASKANSIEPGQSAKVICSPMKSIVAKVASTLMAWARDSGNCRRRCCRKSLSSGVGWHRCGREWLPGELSFRLRRDRQWQCISAPFACLRREFPWLTSTQAFPRSGTRPDDHRWRGLFLCHLPSRIVTRLARQGKKKARLVPPAQCSYFV